MEDKEKRLKFLQDNYGWIAAGFTGGAVIISFILRFIKYIYSNYYFHYYGLSYELFNSNDLNFLYNFGFSVLALLCFCSLMYCYIQLFNFKKLECKTTVVNTLLVFLSNLYIAASINVKIPLSQVFINTLALIFVEVVTSFILCKVVEKEKNKLYKINDLKNIIKITPFYLFLLIIFFLASYGLNIITNKSYRIINDNKVIVYSTNDYYLVLDCEIKDNKLVIYKGKQAKISNENIKSDLIEFVDVELK